MEAAPISHIPAHDSITTVAPFRAWRGLRLHVAGGPKGATIISIKARRHIFEFHLKNSALEAPYQVRAYTTNCTGQQQAQVTKTLVFEANQAHIKGF